MKVRVTIKFRGREVTYPEIALEDLKEIAEALKDVSKIEAAPSMEGKSMTLVLAPDKQTAKKPESSKEEKSADPSGTEKKEKAVNSEKPASKEKTAVPVKPE
jgi:translation initiation factor IF-3